MNYSPTVFLFPDASVLVTLANQEKLDTLFEPNWTLVLIDSVVNEVIRTASPCAEVLGKWLRRNNLPVVQTRAHERAQKAIRMGLSISQQMRMQDLGIQEVMNELALDCGGRLGVFLLEEHRFMSSSFMEPLNCKKFTLRAFQTFLAQRNEAAQAARTVEVAESAKTAKKLVVETVETPEKSSASVQPTHEEMAAYQNETDFSRKVEDVLVAPQSSVADSEDPPLAWLDSKKPVIQPKPNASALAKPAQQQSKLGFITGAAIQLLGRKRAGAVEAAFSKIKESALRLTDASKGVQSKTKPASISPVTRQKLSEPQQNGDDQPTAPPKPVAKFRPNTAGAGSPSEQEKDEPRSVTLQKLLEEHAAARKLAANKAAVANANAQDAATKVATPDAELSSEELNPAVVKKADVDDLPSKPARKTSPDLKKSAGKLVSSSSVPKTQEPQEETPTLAEIISEKAEEEGEPFNLVPPSFSESETTAKSSKADKKRGPSNHDSTISEPLAKIEPQIDERQGSLLVEEPVKTKSRGAKGKAKLNASTKQAAKLKVKEKIKADSDTENKQPPAFLLKKDKKKAENKPEQPSEIAEVQTKRTEQPEPAVVVDEQKQAAVKSVSVPEPLSSVGVVEQPQVDASVQPEQASTLESTGKASADPKLVKDFKNLMA